MPPITGTTPIVEVSNLTMTYGSTQVLRGVNFQIHPGEVVALLGPNGAGKTTTVEILEGFRRRSSGEVTVLGADPASADEDWRARVGVVLQSWRDHGKWRVRELVDYFGSFYAPYATDARRRPLPTDEVLARVGLTDLARHRIGKLSGGQRRRVDVAIGIIGAPELLFLDEPTAGLDPVARRSFHDLVHSLTDFDSTTVLLTTHDLAEAEKLADRILILDQGRIVADGSPDALAAQVAGQSEVRWTQGGQRHVHSSADPTEFVRQLMAGTPDGIHDLEVRRASLEDTYLEMLTRSGQAPESADPEAAQPTSGDLDSPATATTERSPR